MDNRSVTDITFGIRFQTNFRVADFLGQFTERIVSWDDDYNPFKNNYFHRQTQNHREMHLECISSDDKENSYLKININDIIFRHVFPADTNFNQWYAFVESVARYIVRLMNDFSLGNVLRLWIIYNHKSKLNSEKIDTVVNLLTNSKISAPNEFSCTFSKSIIDPASLLDKDNDDFINIIFGFWKSSLESQISIDYQMYFKPSKPKISSSNIDVFLQNSIKAVDKYFYQEIEKKDVQEKN